VLKTRSANPVKRRRQSWLLRFLTVHNGYLPNDGTRWMVFAKNVDNILDRIPSTRAILSARNRWGTELWGLNIIQFKV